MEKVKESKKINLVLVFAAFILCSWNIRAQAPSVPYSVNNNTACYIDIAYEVSETCFICENSGIGGVTIPPNSSINIGTACNPGSIDLHVVIVAIDGVSVSMKSVGYMISSCINSDGTAATMAYPAGTGCTGNINIQYTTGGVNIW